MVNAVLREAAAIDLRSSVVEGCLDPGKPNDVRFATAWHGSLAALPRHERGGALAGVTGHIAESVVEVLLADIGYHPVWHFVGPGRHGVDLLMLSPSADHVLAIEVKGTLRPGLVPRLSRRTELQMSATWVDKLDNPGLAEWELQSSDVYGAIIAVNFADMTIRIVASNDFARWRAVGSLGDLADIADAHAPAP